MAMFDDFQQFVADLPRADRGEVDAVIEAAAGAGAAAMLTFGPVLFGASTATYEQLERRTEYRWPAQDRLGRRPSYQSTGPGEDRITVDGVIFAGYRGRPSVLQALRDLAASGEPRTLAGGDGTVYGEWAVLSIRETRTGLYSDGAARKVAWAMDLVARSGASAARDDVRATARAARDAGDVAGAVDAVTGAADAAAAVAAAEEAAADAAADSPLRAIAVAVRDAWLRGADVRQLGDVALRSASRLPGDPPLARVADVAFRARQGDMLDAIARRRYGDEHAVATLLESTPGLADQASRLTLGTPVGLPAGVGAGTAARRVAQLWD